MNGDDWSCISFSVLQKVAQETIARPETAEEIAVAAAAFRRSTSWSPAKRHRVAALPTVLELEDASFEMEGYAPRSCLSLDGGAHGVRRRHEPDDACWPPELLTPSAATDCRAGPAGGDAAHDRPLALGHLAALDCRRPTDTGAGAEPCGSPSGVLSASGGSQGGTSLGPSPRTSGDWGTDDAGSPRLSTEGRGARVA